MWEGKIQHYGINPYKISPDDVKLDFLKDPLSEKINNKAAPALYPPVTQIIFFLVTKISYSIVAFKILLLMFFISCMILLRKLLEIRKINHCNILLFSWNPLILVETASSGHFDIIGAFFILAGLFYITKNKIYLSISCITIAGLIKFFPFILLPLFLKLYYGQWRKLFTGFVISIAVIILFYIPYTDFTSLSFGSLGTFSKNWSFNSVIYALFIIIFDSRNFYMFLYAMVIGGVLLFLIFRNYTFHQSSFTIIAVFVLFSPVIYPWYLIWLIILFPFITKSLPFNLLSLLVQLSYLILPLYLNDGVWIENPWVIGVEYGLFFIVLLLYYNQFFVGTFNFLKSKFI